MLSILKLSTMHDMHSYQCLIYPFLLVLLLLLITYDKIIAQKYSQFFTRVECHQLQNQNCIDLSKQRNLISKMPKKFVDVWCATQQMYFPEDPLPNNLPLQPFLFKQIDTDCTVENIFDLMKNMGYLPQHPKETKSCFYKFQIGEKSSGIFQEQNQYQPSMLDEEIENSSDYRMSRSTISKLILKSIEQNEWSMNKLTTFGHKIGYLIKRIFQQIPSNFYNKYQIRIYILWRKVTFKLKTKKQYSFISPIKETFHEMYINALGLHPDIIKNLRSLVTEMGNQRSELFFVRYRMYQSQDEENQGQAPNEDEDEHQNSPREKDRKNKRKRRFVVRSPDAEIAWKDGAYHINTDVKPII